MAVVTPAPPPVHDLWLPPAALRPIGARGGTVLGTGLLVDTVRAELRRATDEHLPAAPGNGSGPGDYRRGGSR
jgi:hypothetical protein